ncbi:MAG: cobalamin-dependent protein [Phycisphaerae bacterium]|nr:cobalamin-dependent protein [Phycisphaerae bacterium]
MQTVEIFKQYLEHLFSGNRSSARELLFDANDRGFGAERLLTHIIWPAMEQIERLYRKDRISKISEHIATRINRMLANQLQRVLRKNPQNGRRIVVLCGDDERAELGAQIMSDMFEAQGWNVWFIGGGVANDEILKFVGQTKPDILMVHASLPPEVPEVRKLIKMIREVGICEEMQVMVCGGIYNRAEDLAEEINADLFAHDPTEALCLVESSPQRIIREDKPEPGRRRKRKKKQQLVQIQELRDRLGVPADTTEEA